MLLDDTVSCVHCEFGDMYLEHVKQSKAWSLELTTNSGP